MSWEFIDPLAKLIQRQVYQQPTRDAGFPARSLVSGIALICSFILIGCVPSSWDMRLLDGTQPLVKIGLAAPFEGLGRPLGYEALAGVKLALSERNAAGGIAGHTVELVALNDFGEPDEARLQAREFAADPAVLGVVTGWTGETARASLPVYQEAGLAVAVPWSVPPQLADRESGIILVAADAQRTASKLTQAVAATDPRQLVIVGDRPSVVVYQEATSALGLDVQVFSLPSVLDGEMSSESSMHLADALILATDGATAGEALLTLASENWHGVAFGGVEAGSVHVVDVAGSAADSLTFVSPAPAGRDTDPMQNKQWLGPRAVLAYDATHVLLDAIELAIRENGYPSRPGVAAALPTVRRHGLTGEIAFDPAGRRVKAPVWLYNIRDKSYPGQVLVSPPTTNGE